MSMKQYIVMKLENVPYFNRLFAKRRIRIHLSKFLTSDEIQQAERDINEKKRSVSTYFAKWPDRFSDDVKMVEKLLNNAPCFAERKEKDEIRNELLFNRIGYGFHPEEYVCYELEGKSPQIRDGFYSSKECVRDVYRMNDFRDSQILNNKGRTYKKYKDYYKRDAVYITKADDYDAFLNFVHRHPVFVKKNVYEAMGRSVELIDIKTCGVSEKEYFDKLIQIGPHLLEERVIQSEVMAKLHPASVNTVRCITFNTKHGIKDPYYFMKIGQAGAFVDNGGAGGILVGIDNETGRLNTVGYDELNRKYTVHPDSNITFIGYQLPDWKQMKAICKELSAQLPRVKYIGWDMAHTDDGWVIIEGNGASQMIGPQTVFKRGCKAEVEALMADMDLIV